MSVTHRVELGLEPRNAGSTMIEVLVSVVVVAIGLLGMASLQLNSVKTSFDSAGQSQASWLAQEMAERIRSNKSDAAEFYIDAAANNASCGMSPSVYCGLVHGVSSVDSCTPEQRAVFDVWDVFCNVAADDELYASAADMISLSSFSIGCDDSDVTDSNTCSGGSLIDISIEIAGRSVVNEEKKNRNVQIYMSL